MQRTAPTTLDEVFGNSRMVRALEAGSVRTGESTADAIRRIGTEAVEPDLLKHMQGVSKQLDDLLGARQFSPGVLKKAEVARQVGALAKARGIDLGLGTIPHHIRTLQKEGMIDQLVNQMVYSKAVTESIKASKDMKFLSNIVQVTANTFAPRGSLKEVLTFVKEKTKAGRLSARLVDEKVPIININTERGPELYFDLTKAKNGEEIGRMYDEVVAELQQFRRLSGADIRLDGRIARLSEDSQPLSSSLLIGVSDLRTAIDGTIDLVSRGSQLNRSGKVVGQGLFRASDTANLPVARQLDLLQPGVARTDTLAGTAYRQIVKPLLPKHLTSPFFKKIKEILPTWGDEVPQTLNVAQRRSLNEMKNSLDTMDRGLRKRIKRFRNDPDFRRSLGVPKGKEGKYFFHDDLNEIVGYLTVGKGRADPDELSAAAYTPRPINVIRGDIEGQLSRSLEWTALRYVYATHPKAGLKAPELVFSDSFLTPSGRTALDDLSKATAKEMYMNPGDYTRLYSEFLQEWHALLKSNAASYIEPSLHKSLKLSTQGAEVPNELLAGTYFHIQRDRILNATAKRMFESDVSSAKAVLGESWNPAWRDPITRHLKTGLGDDFDLQKVFDYALRERTVARLESSLGGAPLKPVEEWKDDVLLDVLRSKDPTDAPILPSLLNRDPSFKGRRPAAVRHHQVWCNHASCYGRRYIRCYPQAD
jgi:hypothetical protein